MRSDSRSIRLFVAIGAAVFAILLRVAGEPIWGTQDQWLLFILGVTVSAWFGGLKPGLLTATPLVFIGCYLDGLRAPDVSSGASATPLVSAILFSVVSMVICTAMQRLRSANLDAHLTSTRFHDVLESTQDGILSLNSEFLCLYANARAGHIARRAPALLYGKSLRMIFPETPTVSIYKELQRCLREQAAVHFEHKTEASNVWHEFDAYPSPSGLNLFIRDITARKNSEWERTTFENEQLRLESVLWEMPVGIVIASSDMRVQFVNRAASDMFGSEIRTGLDFKAFYNGKLQTLSGEPFDPNQSPMRQTLRSGKRVDNFEVEYIRPDGGVMSLIINSLPLLNADGNLRGAMCTYAEVTSIRSVQKALAVSEARLRRLFDSPIIGVISGNEESILEANDAFLSMLGYSRGDLAEGRLKWPGLTPPGFEERDARSIHQLTERGFADQFEKEYIAKDGRRVPIILGTAAYDKGHWSPWISWVLDRSEHRKLENRLREAARLESIGVLAGGIAHDFNNILTSILANASLAYENLPDGDKARELLENAIRSTERAADLTRQLLAYAGKGHFIVQPVNVAALAVEIRQLIRTSIPRNVELELRLPPNLPLVRADSTQLQQLIMNLVINGAEAVGEAAGLVEVVIGELHLSANLLQTLELDMELSTGDYISVEVRDNGSGMDPQTLERIFDPFFTTKFTGRGLGLAAARGIVRAHNGAIRVTSQLGKGSTFHVLLPVSNEPLVAETDKALPVQPNGVGTILVVDDDQEIRTVARNTLERYGYTVLLAANGKDGLDIYRGLSHSISMVILDLTMPKMSGEETMGNLFALNPALKILLTSGYDCAETLQRFSEKGLAGFLQKPYTATLLGVKVHELLSEFSH